MFNAYKLHLKGKSYKKDLIEKFILYNLIILYPICPHFTEIMYQTYVPNKTVDSITKLTWPDNLPVDMSVIKKLNYIENLLRTARLTVDKIKHNNIKRKIETPSNFLIKYFIYN